MINIFRYNPNARSLDGLKNVHRVQFFLWYSLVLLITFWLVYKMIDATYLLISVDGIEWDYSKLAWLLYVLGVVVIFLQPRYGVYLTVGLALAGDYTITYWFPFELNFSSEQSLLYFNDSLKLSPLETYLLMTALSYFLRLLISSKWDWREKLFFGPMFLPGLFFTGFIAFGFIYGIGTGGDRQVALWEVRPIFYLFLTMVLASNLFEKREHIHNFMWVIVIALLYEAIMGLFFINKWWKWSFGSHAGLGAHEAAIHFNAVFIFMLATFLYKVAWPKRFLLMSIAPVLGLTYIAMQRRASFLTLGIAIALCGIIFFKLNRKLFFFLAPIVTAFGLLYVLAFWNSGSSIAMPAQAVKSIVAPAEGGADAESNQYRDIENADTHFTIRQHPLTGVGFGKKFYMPYPLPDISFFEWWEYITHNSIIWIWMKSGVGGFFTMFWMIGMALMTGGRLLWKMPNNEMAAVLLSMTLYVLMHFMFAYVDISWGAQSMLLVGAAMGIINKMEKIMRTDVAREPRRWRWQAEREVEPVLEG